jgi:bacteriocin resistance YdeI/OmpD-like protein
MFRPCTFDGSIVTSTAESIPSSYFSRRNTFARCKDATRNQSRSVGHFQALVRTYRRDFVVWIHIAKRPETRDKRIRESIELLAAGKLGLK